MAQLLKISANSSREIRATVQGLKLFPNEYRKWLRKETQQMALPAWQEELSKRPATVPQSAILVRTARVSVSDQNVMLKSATVGRSLAGGAKPSTLAAAEEFGGNRDKVRTYRTRSRKGNSYNVTRHTQRQLPTRRRNGYVVYPAASEIIPRVAKLWVQTFVRTIYEAIERK